MPTINDLGFNETPSLSDQIPSYSSSSGTTQRTSINNLLAAAAQLPTVQPVDGSNDLWIDPLDGNAIKAAIGPSSQSIVNPVQTVLNLANGTAPDAGTLTGAEIVPMNRSAGLLQTTLTKIAQWVIQTYQGFTQGGTGAVVRTVQDKLSDIVTSTDFGASTALADNSVVLATAVGNGKPIQMGSGTYPLTNFFQSLTQPVLVRGTSQYRTTFQQNSAVSMSSIANSNSSGAQLSNLSISTPSSVSGTIGQVISMTDVNDATVSDVSITGLAGTGSAVIVLPSVNTTVNNVRLRDLKIVGNLSQAVNNNGTLIVNGLYCQQRGIYADSIHDFAVEYKNATAYSTLSDVIVNNSSVAVEYGNTTSPGVQWSAAANMVSKDCAIGFEMGIASYNVATNMVIAINTPFAGSATKDGVRFESASNFNSFSNFLFQGTFNNPVNHFSNFNYISGAFHNVGVVGTLEAGAAGNVTAINHPGARSTIYAAMTDSSGQTLSGANSNPVYCHATGEYLGSLSNRWRWVHAKSGFGVQNSAHKWVDEGVGDSFRSVLTDGTGSAGYTVSTNGKVHGLTYSWASDFWQLDAGTTNYRFFSNSVQTLTDNVSALGASANRWSNVFSVTATLSGPIALQKPSTVATATYSQAATDSSLIFNGAATQTLTLLSAATFPGRILHVTNVAAFALNSATSNVVPLGSTTAGTAILSATGGKFAMLQSDGTNWVTMMSN